MNSPLPLLLLLLTMTSCIGQTEVIEERYPNGNKKVVHIFNTVNTNDSIIKVVGYRENGDLSFTLFTLNDKLHGTLTQRYIDADQIQRKTNYNKQKQDGLETFWYRNGQKWQEVNYSNDLKHGTEAQWYENGNRQSEGTWEHGKNVEEWTYWYENGLIKEQGTYKGGQYEELPIFSSKGRPDFIPLKDGEWTYWTEGGDIAKVEHWEQGQLGKE